MFVEKENVFGEESEVCRPLFKPEMWNKMQHARDEKLFLKDCVPELFHIPLPGTYQKAIAGIWRKVGMLERHGRLMIFSGDQSP